MNRLTAYALLFFLTSSPAFAACGFDTTFGTGTTDSVLTSFFSTVNTQQSFAARIWINGSGGGTAGRIIQLSNELISSGFSSILQEIQVPFTTTAGVFTWTTPSTGAWHSLVVTYDGSSTANVPGVYIDGSSVAVATLTPPVGTYNSAAVALIIGNNATGGNRFWDGIISQVSYWNVILTANEAKSYAQGMSALNIRPSAQKFYFPLTTCGMPDWINHTTTTVTGTKFQPEPPSSAFPYIRTGNP